MTETQLRLNDVMNKHKCSLQLHDNVVELINGYIKSDQFCPFAKWKRRKHIMRDVENAFQTGHLKPTNGTVRLHDQSLVTIPVFDIKHLIINMLTDPTLMHKDNLVRGHNIFTGEMDEASEHAHVYGEIPTGDAWKPARDRYCKESGLMPIGSVVFGDKSHTDLQGALSLTPIIFTLTIFNCKATRNNPIFWRPIAYIPNLQFGKTKSDRTDTADKVQDEHVC
jgi:hypothetical protein